MSKFVVSTSRARVWRKPEDHPLLKHTDMAHPALRGKLEDDPFPPRVAEGLPKILSENSEDARTWYYFSPLLNDEPQRTRVLTLLLRQSFAFALPPQAFKQIPHATLEFWPRLPPPPSRLHKEGESEPDLLIKLGDSAVVLVEAKCMSGISEFTTYDRKRDQVIRLLDVGSWYARQEGYQCSCLLVLQYRQCTDQRREDNQPLRRQPRGDPQGPTLPRGAERRRLRPAGARHRLHPLAGPDGLRGPAKSLRE